jgi:hypothetical protein
MSCTQKYHPPTHTHTHTHTQNDTHPQGAFELARALRSNSTLRALALRACALHDGGASAACAALGEAPALASLDLSDNAGAGWAPLPQLATGLRRGAGAGALESLKLEGWVDAFQEVGSAFTVQGLISLRQMHLLRRRLGEVCIVSSKSRGRRVVRQR